MGTELPFQGQVELSPTARKVWSWIWLVLAVPSVVLSGYTIAKLWLWFAVPLGAPHVGIVQALGLATLVRSMTWFAVPRPRHWEVMDGMLQVFGPLLYLLTGWILKTFFL